MHWKICFGYYILIKSYFFLNSITAKQHLSVAKLFLKLKHEKNCVCIFYCFIISWIKTVFRHFVRFRNNNNKASGQFALET